MNMQHTDLKKFLLKAKNGTYASQNKDAYVAPLLQGSVQLEFREGDFFYRDIYFGINHFMGQETVYKSDIAVWAMCYSGGINSINNPENPENIYKFLQRAMLNVPSDLPVRGPEEYVDNGMKYLCRIKGTFESFRGNEEIFVNGKSAFRLDFSGGNII